MAELFNKIGFHIGVSGNLIGLSGWMAGLTAQKIPFFLKSVDNYAPIHEAVTQYMRPTNLPHTLVFRLSFAGQGGFNYDTPRYSSPPKDAADLHWRRTTRRLPPEFDKKRVWLELVNEVDKERADWLGHFAARIGELALRDGYKVALFGWANGDPEEADLETEGMLRYLRACAENPKRLAVALHEYSYKTDNIWFMRNHHIGRFLKLFRVCDRYRLQRPSVLITEWGWTKYSVPEPETAVDHIRQAGELYARHPEILGAAIWNLGGGVEFGSIAHQTQRLIKPVLDFTLSHRFIVADEPAAVTPPPDPQPELPRGKSNVRFIKDVTIPDDIEKPVGTAFEKTWRVENSGQRAWGPGFKLIFAGGEPMTAVLEHDLPAAQPGEQVDITLKLTLPDRLGVHYSDWRFQDDEGNLFGDIIYTRLKAAPAPPPPPPAGLPGATFLTDVTIPDDMEIQPGRAFTKSWKVRNSGTRAWTNTDELFFLRGAAMTNQDSFPLPPTPPGGEAEISISLAAPEKPGSYFGDWRFRDQNGRVFGDIVYLRITVPHPRRAIGIEPLSQRDPRWSAARLGDARSRETIGNWGCLLTTFAMIANAYGRDLTPPQLNSLIVNGQGFINNNWTPWNALDRLYNDVIFDGRLETRFHPNIVDRINGAMQAGTAVAIQVDITPNTPYVDEDQHWVLLVGRDGDDYRVYDPINGQEVSLRDVYGRPGQPLRDAILSAIFYRSTRSRINYGVLEDAPQPAPIPTPTPTPTPAPASGQLQVGMNVNPDAPYSNPYNEDTFKGLDWARFVFKVAAQPDPNNRNLQAAFARYDPIIRAYGEMNISSLIILNQETVWGNAPWAGNNDWQSYANSLADMAGRIGAHYAHYGARVAYQIWNEGDLRNNPSSVFVPAKEFAHILRVVSQTLRRAAPQAKLIFGGTATGPEETIKYWQACQQALGEPLPVDALAVHPYGRWGTRAPFDWGQKFGTISDALRQYKAAYPNTPIWITEIGVADDSPIGPQYYEAIADYMRDVYKTVAARHSDQVEVLIWFAWSDLMRNAGIMDAAGGRKPYVYDAFRDVRSKQL
jgi:hypothetical protein